MRIRLITENAKSGKWLGEVTVGQTAVAKYRLLPDNALEVQMRLSDGAYSAIESANPMTFPMPRGRLAVSIDTGDGQTVLANKMRGAILNLMTNIMTIGKDFWFNKSAKEYAAAFLRVYQDMANNYIYDDAAAKILEAALSISEE